MTQDIIREAGADLIPAWVDGVLRPLEKLDVHRRGLRHPAVSVFVRRGDNLLLQRRALSKYHTPGLWANACCTHPRPGEDPADCARRRLEEELGLAGLGQVYSGEIEYRADVGNGLTEHEVVAVYWAEAEPGQEPCPDPREVAETAWMTLEELESQIAAVPEAFTPWLRIYLRDHRAMLFPRAGV